MRRLFLIFFSQISNFTRKNSRFSSKQHRWYGGIEVIRNFCIGLPVVWYNFWSTLTDAAFLFLYRRTVLAGKKYGIGFPLLSIGFSVRVYFLNLLINILTTRQWCCFMPGVSPLAFRSIPYPQGAACSYWEGNNVRFLRRSITVMSIQTFYVIC